MADVMGNIAGGFQGFGNVMEILKWVLYIGGALVVCVILVGAVILIIIKTKERKIIEINIVNRKMKIFAGRERKNKGGRLQTWIGKLKKWLPRLQEEDIFLENGKKETILLLKDNNGMHHSLRPPTLEELKKWYKVVHNIDIEAEEQKIRNQLIKEGIIDETEQTFAMLDKIKETNQGNPLIDKALSTVGTVYLIPNVLEDLNWCADQLVEADKTYMSSWWQNPAIVWLGTFAMLTILTIIWFILMKRV